MRTILNKINVFYHNLIMKVTYFARYALTEHLFNDIENQNVTGKPITKYVSSLYLYLRGGVIYF